MFTRVNPRPGSNIWPTQGKVGMGLASVATSVPTLDAPNVGMSFA